MFSPGRIAKSLLTLNSGKRFLQTMKKTKMSVSWSGGKDSAFALYQLLKGNNYEAVELHTVFNAENNRVGMHGTHEKLIEKQAEALGIPLTKLYLDSSHTSNAYEKLIMDYYRVLIDQGVHHVMFGDIFLEDLKEFRDSILKKCGMSGVYPLWEKPSEELLNNFIDSGFRSVICAADTDKIPKEYVGRYLGREILELNVDPCGENGEYHSFVTHSPMFSKPINLKMAGVRPEEYEYEVLKESGEKELHRIKFWFADIN